MAKGTQDSKWRVYFHPETGHHVPWTPWNATGFPTRPAHLTWDDWLDYVRYERGRSSVNVILEGRDHTEYSMFFAEFMRLLPYFERGGISGRWGFEKNGSNTGIYRVSA